jgi:hypothetical protein
MLLRNDPWLPVGGNTYSKVENQPDAAGAASLRRQAASRHPAACRGHVRAASPRPAPAATIAGDRRGTGASARRRVPRALDTAPDAVAAKRDVQLRSGPRRDAAGQDGADQPQAGTCATGRRAAGGLRRHRPVRAGRDGVVEQLFRHLPADRRLPCPGRAARGQVRAVAEAADGRHGNAARHVRRTTRGDAATRAGPARQGASPRAGAAAATPAARPAATTGNATGPAGGGRPAAPSGAGNSTGSASAARPAGPAGAARSAGPPGAGKPAGPVGAGKPAGPSSGGKPAGPAGQSSRGTVGSGGSKR